MSLNFYTEDEITKAQIDFMDEVVKTRDNTYPMYYRDEINCLEDLKEKFYTIQSPITLVTAEDWFFTYSIDEKYEMVFLLEWVSKKESNPLRVAKDMKKVLLKIIENNKDKTFNTGLKHNTSYKLYNAYLKRGYIQEISHDISCVENIGKFSAETYSEIMNWVYQDNDEFPLPKHEDILIHELIFKISNTFPFKKK